MPGLFCRPWGCSAVLPPVGMPGCSAAGGDSRGAALPPVLTRGGLRPPRSVARHRALARPMPAPAPPRRHSPAALASRSLFGAATRRGTTRATPALLLENPTIRSDGGAARGHREGRDAHAGPQAPTREAARRLHCEQRAALLVVPRPVDPSRRAREAGVAGECRRGGG